MHVVPYEPALSSEEAAVALMGQDGCVWLDGDGAGGQGRCSFVASDPVDVLRVARGTPDPLAALEGLDGSHGEQGRAHSALPPIPHWIGYVAYDAGREARTGHGADDMDTPLLWFGRYEAVLVVDHDTGRRLLVGDTRAACTRLAERIERGRRGRRPAARVGAPLVAAAAEHRAAIERALEHIAAGDIYQVNLARRWSAPFSGDALALALAMRRASPVPFGFFLDAGDHAVCTRTMERFLSWQQGELTTRPIKGTIARAGDDAIEAESLRTDPKERAEHAMIVDLMRNDLGRVAEIGSVTVREVMAVEPYAKLSHLVSTVACRTRPDVTLTEVLRATFPPGSVTGTPKIRAMEIIDALEPVPRGVYTGAVGHVDRGGGLSLAVAIRTAVVQGERVHYHAGGGLVAASVPEREIAETELKARAFLDAAERLAEAGGSC